MTDNQWRTAWRILNAARELPPAQRPAFLAQETNDPEVAARVNQLLDTPSDAENFDPAPSSPRRDYTGAQIGRYQVRELLRAGGMGQVYNAFDQDLARPVALKFLLPGATADPHALRRFIQEAKAASALNHPNILTIYEVVDSTMGLAIAMELVEGQPLRELIGQSLPLAQVIDIARQATSALAAAHAAEIVHRDIKPENLMLRPDGFLKVLDFGLARRIAPEFSTQSFSSSATGLPAGTLRYMSPEQLRNEPLTKASDVYALGIVLYELLTKQHPFESTNAIETAFGIHSKEAPQPSALQASVPAWLDALVAAMLSRDPAQRPTMSAVAETLAKQDSLQKPLLSAPQRSKAGVLILAIAATLILALLFWQRQAPSTKPVALQAQTLTGLDGIELFPTISPDGRQVLFIQEDDNRKNSLHLKLVGGGPPIRLDKDNNNPEANAGNIVDPAWSPDGLQIAFGRQTPEYLSLRIMPALGGAEREIAKVATIVKAERTLTWSPDKEALLATGPVTNEPGQRQAIFRFPLDGSPQTQLTSPPANQLDQAPAYSPDGAKLAFLRRNGRNGNVYLLEGGSTRRLTTGNEVIDSLVWSADSQSILYTQSRPTGRTLWRLPLSGDAPHQVAEIGLNPFNPSISAKGNRLVYAHMEQTRADIWRLPLPAPNAKQPPPAQKIITSTGLNVDPADSPDGARIAFASTRSGALEIWVANADGSNPLALTSFGTIDGGSPRWSPDGSKIAFDKSSSVWIVGANGGAPQKLVAGSLPAWSADGQTIYFVSHQSGQDQIWKIPTTGGPALQVTRQGGFEALASPDGKFLYYTKSQDRAGLWRLPLAGGPETEFPALRPVVSHRYWSASPRALYFLDLQSGATQLKRYDLSTGIVTPSLTAPAPFLSLFRGLSVQRSDDSLLWVQRVRRVSQIIIVDGFQ